MVKFPCTTSLFRKIPPGHHQPFLRDNSDGLFNGLYFVPGKISPEEMVIKPVKTNHLDLKKKCKNASISEATPFEGGLQGRQKESRHH